jgi:Ca2+-transporting ATPase
MTDGSFLRTMLLTGFLTAAPAFVVFFYVLQTGTVESARTYAFTVLVFAELLRSFGVRSETKQVWRMSLFTNVHLVLVVCLSFILQVWSQHSEIFARFLKTSFVPFTDCLLLFAIGAIPLLVLEMIKLIRHSTRDRIVT